MIKEVNWYFVFANKNGNIIYPFPLFGLINVGPMLTVDKAEYCLFNTLHLNNNNNKNITINVNNTHGLLNCHIQIFLAHRIRIYEILPWDGKPFTPPLPM